jgi:two-component system response regulator RegA
MHQEEMTSSVPLHTDLLLIVEDDQTLRQRLAQSMASKGYDVVSAGSIAEASECLDGNHPAFAVVDMRLGDGSGLDFMASLKQRVPDCRAVMLTGYGSIATAVWAIGAGAFDFLAKPADADEIHNALRAHRHDELAIPFVPSTSDRLRREHIDAMFETYGRNVSETARRLNMHRRTLQRILAKNVQN